MVSNKDDMPDWRFNPKINHSVFNIPSVGGSGCSYTNDVTNVGRLFCPSVAQEGVTCKGLEDRTNIANRNNYTNNRYES
jgi:hypothetical protein